jgi:hypothetical protein
MVNVLVSGNKLGELESKLHKEGYSIWRICDSGKIKVKSNISKYELKKMRLKNLISEEEFKTINIYETYRRFVKKE